MCWATRERHRIAIENRDRVRYRNDKDTKVEEGGKEGGRRQKSQKII